MSLFFPIVAEIWPRRKDGAVPHMLEPKLLGEGW